METQPPPTAGDGGQPPSPGKKPKQSPKQKGQQGPKGPRPRLRLVIRKLPPQLTKETFEKSLERFKDIITSMYFVTGKVSKSRNDRDAYARGYITLATPENVQSFYDAFDKHPFVNTKGEEYRAQVEYAPSQKNAKKRNRRPDPRENTIEDDPDFKEFLEQYNAPPEPMLSAEAQYAKKEAEDQAARAANDGKRPVISTPLLEHMKKRAKQKAHKREIKAEMRKKKNKGKQNDKKKGKRGKGGEQAQAFGGNQQQKRPDRREKKPPETYDPSSGGPGKGKRGRGNNRRRGGGGVQQGGGRGEPTPQQRAQQLVHGTIKIQKRADGNGSASGSGGGGGGSSFKLTANAPVFMPTGGFNASAPVFTPQSRQHPPQ